MPPAVTQKQRKSKLTGNTGCALNPEYRLRLPVNREIEILQVIQAARNLNAEPKRLPVKTEKIEILQVIQTARSKMLTDIEK